MTQEERVELALDHALAARKEIVRADLESDPVAQRRIHVIAAGHFRKAADLLDDEERLEQ